jgi:hypothetical protein
MILKNFIILFDRDLKKLISEIESYSDEKSLWQIEGNVTNSAGNLILHLIGNLHHFIGKEIGGFDYTRDREFEFGGKNIPKDKLLAEINDCKNKVIISLEGMDPSLLEQDFPLEVFGKKMSYFFFLTHLYGHFNYHLGQINYHRRLLGS